MYTTHTRTHFFFNVFPTTQLLRPCIFSKCLVRFSEWKCGIDKAHFKIDIYTRKYIYECMCTSSAIVNVIFLCFKQPKQRQQKKART